MFRLLPNGLKRSPQWRKRTTLLTFSLQVANDLVAITLGLFLALRLNQVAWDNRYSVLLLYALGMFLVFANLKQLYRSWRGGFISAEIQAAIEAWLLVFAMTFVTGHLWPEIAWPQNVTLGWLLLTPLFLGSSRVLGRSFLHFFRRRGLNTRKLAVVGNGGVALHLSSVIDASPWTGYRQVGRFDPRPPETAGNPNQGSTRTLDDLVEIARGGGLDTVFIGVSATEPVHWVNDLLRRLSDTTVSVYVTRDRRSRTDPSGTDNLSPLPVDPILKNSEVLHRCWIEIGGIPALSVYESPFQGASGWLKRLEDLLAAGLIMLVIALPMLAIAVGVKLSSPGPILFKQRRYGLSGDEIIVWKFRSMTLCEDGDTVVQARKEDPRVTPFGAFLRRTSLDELPQFINVLLGTMSIVGPRPHAVIHNEQYRTLIDGYMLRHKVKPGITGLAQVRGLRGETDTLDKMAKRIESDLEYIRNWSLWLDLQIIVLTILKGFRQANAY